MTSDWRPVLDGPLRDRALEAALDVGRTVAAGFRADSSPPARGDASLSRGWTGTAVTMHYLHRAFPGEGFGSVAEAALDRAAEAVAAQPMNVGLMQGFPGVAWAIEHLGENRGPEDANSGIDDALIAMLQGAEWGRLYDLVSGAAGVGVYALTRLDRPSGRRCLDLVVGRLEEWAEPAEPGLTWYTPAELVPPSARDRVPEGYYNLGVAHGVPGTIALLAHVERSGGGGPGVRRLVEGAVEWTLAQALPPGERATWPYFVGPGVEPGAARLAWCYGDPGIVVALLAAADALGRPEWERAALDALGQAVRRPPESSDVQGASLCHGSMGLAHLWNRLWQRYPSEELRESIRFWTAAALDARVHADGLAGYSVWRPGHDDEGGDVQGPGLLAGIAGIALALVAAATDQEPAWDSHLLLSGPAR